VPVRVFLFRAVLVWPFSVDLRLPAVLPASAAPTTAAAIAAEAATATTAATAAKSAATTGSAGFFRPRFIDRQRASTQLRFVQFRNGFLRALIGRHFDKAEAACATGGHVAHDRH